VLRADEVGDRARDAGDVVERTRAQRAARHGPSSSASGSGASGHRRRMSPAGIAAFIETRTF
jgi:hypothetical protein